MSNNQNNSIIVVIGAGRTGSSMLANILFKMGMNGSSNLIEGNYQNTEGFFEDKSIVNLHKEVFSFLNISAYSLVEDSQFKDKGLRNYKEKLVSIVKSNIDSSNNIWGFKDPRTATLLPLWSQVYNTLKIKPIYILTIRNPSEVVVSMSHQYQRDENTSELIWLVRTVDALYNSAGNCFIVHYEDWFTNKAKSLATSLEKFTGLRQSSKDIDEIISGVVKKSLNRSSYKEYKIKNPLVSRLYNELKKCHGEEFNKDDLMKVVLECRQEIQSFMGVKKFSAVSKELEKENAKLTSTSKDLENENVKLTSTSKELENENVKLTSISKALKDENTKFVIKHNKIMQTTIEVNELRDENIKLTLISKELENENIKLTSTSKELENENVKLTLISKELENENVKLTSTSKELENENVKLTSTSKALKDENTKFVIKHNKIMQTTIEVNELRDENIKLTSVKKDLDELNNRKKIRLEKLSIKNQNKDKKILQCEVENFKLKTSFSYKLGLTFVNAIKKPGKNTILFPYYFFKVILEKILVAKYVS